MSCPTKKIWNLFYYKDLDPGKIKDLNQHLKVCLRCQAYYSQLTNILTQTSQDQVDLPKTEISRMVSEVTKTKSNLDNIFESFKTKSADFVARVESKIFYQPQLAFAMVAILLIVLFIPLQRQQAIFESQVLDLEIDLVIGQDDFETYLDLYFFDEQSQKLSSTTISS